MRGGLLGLDPDVSRLCQKAHDTERHLPRRIDSSSSSSGCIEYLGLRDATDSRHDGGGVGRFDSGW